MKIRVTIMTENDKHIDTSVSDEKIKAYTEAGWQAILSMMVRESDDPSEKAIVESCELIER